MIKTFRGHTTCMGEHYAELYIDMISILDTFNRIATEEKDIQILIAEEDELSEELIQFTKTVVDIRKGHIGQTSD